MFTTKSLAEVFDLSSHIPIRLANKGIVNYTAHSGQDPVTKVMECINEGKVVLLRGKEYSGRLDVSRHAARRSNLFWYCENRVVTPDDLIWDLTDSMSPSIVPGKLALAASFYGCFCLESFGDFSDGNAKDVLEMIVSRGPVEIPTSGGGLVRTRLPDLKKYGVICIAGLDYDPIKHFGEDIASKLEVVTIRPVKIGRKYPPDDLPA